MEALSSYQAGVQRAFHPSESGLDGAAVESAWIYRNLK